MPRPVAPEHSESKLLDRLLEHASLHDELVRHGADDEQRMWADDLREAHDEIERLRAANLDCIDWFEQLKADYDRLRERIETAPVTTVNHFWQAMFHFQGNAVPEEGKRVRLVVEEG